MGTQVNQEGLLEDQEILQITVSEIAYPIKILLTFFQNPF